MLRVDSLDVVATSELTHKQRDPSSAAAANAARPNGNNTERGGDTEKVCWGRLLRFIIIFSLVFCVLVVHSVRWALPWSDEFAFAWTFKQWGRAEIAPNGRCIILALELYSIKSSYIFHNHIRLFIFTSIVDCNSLTFFYNENNNTIIIIFVVITTYR